MKASELIEELQSLIDLHGDSTVYVSDRDEYDPGYISVEEVRMRASCGAIMFVIK